MILATRRKYYLKYFPAEELIDFLTLPYQIYIQRDSTLPKSKRVMTEEDMDEIVLEKSKGSNNYSYKNYNNNNNNNISVMNQNPKETRKFRTLSRREITVWFYSREIDADSPPLTKDERNPMRNLSFEDYKHFAACIEQTTPNEIHIGPFIKVPWSALRAEEFKFKTEKFHYPSHLYVKENSKYQTIDQKYAREFWIDIDANLIDHIRTCCSKAKICSRCSGILRVNMEILKVIIPHVFSIKDEFVFFYSGNRSIHVCIYAPEVFGFTGNKFRAYCSSTLFNLLEPFALTKKNGTIKVIEHIVKAYFYDEIILKQERLTNETHLNDFVQSFFIYLAQTYDLVPEIKTKIQECLSAFLRFRLTAPDQHRSLLENIIISLNELTMEMEPYRLPLPNGCDRKSHYYSDIYLEMLIFIFFPRIDFGVSQTAAHLIRSPFSLHVSGKIDIVIPYDKTSEFNSENYPTYIELCNEEPRALAMFNESVQELRKINQNLMKTFKAEFNEILKEKRKIGEMSLEF